jgi:hypothetical protein
MLDSPARASNAREGTGGAVVRELGGTGGPASSRAATPPDDGLVPRATHDRAAA